MKDIKNLRPMKRLFVVILAAAIALPAALYAFERQSVSGNGVRVDAVPVQLESGKIAKFDVSLSTHSVELGHDMTAVSILKDNQGNEYRPIEWQGSKPGGHHRRGELVFPELKGNPESVILIIKDIAGVPQRDFQWTVDR